LPVGYSAAQRYPVLYLLHGHGGGGYLDWGRHGVDELVGGRPVIVVMPEGGYDGFYSDWYGRDVVNDVVANKTGPVPAWETFHIRELIPWVDATFATIATRGGRAIAGNSMGGFGAMSYAARHPDLFVAAGAFSGAVNTTLASPVGPLVQAAAANVTDSQLPDNCIWGDPVTQSVRWGDHDPTVLASNLRGLSLYQRVGDGTAGVYDDFAAKQPSAGAVLNEFGISLMNHAFDDALTRAGIAHRATFEHGIHDWPYWLDDLREFLPIAEAAFAHPPAAPPATRFAYKTATSTFAVWGWSFRSDQPDASRFIHVSRAGRRGFAVRGAGTLHVDTAALFVPGRTYVINRTNQVADAAGRLHTDVALSSREKFVRIAAVRV
jgi:S-formylglutathione hydrolase FrmB